MRYALLATVGTNDFRLPDEILKLIGEQQLRDLRHDAVGHWNELPPLILVDRVQKLDKLRNNARKWGQEFEAYKAQYKPNLDDFPILKPALEVKDEQGAINEHIETILLFATDHINERVTDTIHYANIMKEFLLPAAQKQRFLGRCQEIRVITLKSDVELYDQAYREIQQHIDVLQAELSNFDRICILPTAGTPAMSWGLLQAATRRLGPKVFVVYTGRPGLERD